MLDVARAIVEKQPADTMEKVDILSALAEVSLERGRLTIQLSTNIDLRTTLFVHYCSFLMCPEDVETSLSDYLKSLSILESLVEPDSRLIAELYPPLSWILLPISFYNVFVYFHL